MRKNDIPGAVDRHLITIFLTLKKKKKIQKSMDVFFIKKPAN